MKKILCLIDGLGFGGAQRQIIGLAHYLQSSGYDVTLASYHKKDFYNQLLADLKIKHVLLKTGNKFSKFVRVYDFIKKGDFDVVISYLVGPNILCCLSKILGIKSKVIVSERITDVGVHMIDRVKFNLYRVSSFVVPNSYSQQQYLSENFNFLERKTHVITNFTDTDAFRPAEIKINKDKTELLVAGRISTQKNILRFLDAIKILKDRNIPVHISWYGNIGRGMEDYRQKVLEKLNEFDLADTISFSPGINDIVTKYQECTAFCLPSLYEGFSNVICEAMSCGKPILCSNVCDNPHLVENGVNGFLFDPLSAESIANAISDFCKLSDNQIDEMGRKSREKIVTMCSPQIFISKYIGLIER